MLAPSDQFRGKSVSWPSKAKGKLVLCVSAFVSDTLMFLQGDPKEGHLKTLEMSKPTPFPPSHSIFRRRGEALKGKIGDPEGPMVPLKDGLLGGSNGSFSTLEGTKGLQKRPGVCNCVDRVPPRRSVPTFKRKVGLICPPVLAKSNSSKLCPCHGPFGDVLLRSNIYPGAPLDVDAQNPFRTTLKPWLKPERSWVARNGVRPSTVEHLISPQIHPHLT